MGDIEDKNQIYAKLLLCDKYFQIITDMNLSFELYYCFMEKKLQSLKASIRSKMSKENSIFQFDIEKEFDFKIFITGC